MDREWFYLMIIGFLLIGFFLVVNAANHDIAEVNRVWANRYFNCSCDCGGMPDLSYVNVTFKPFGDDKNE